MTARPTPLARPSAAASVAAVWAGLRAEGERAATAEPVLAPLLRRVILDRADLADGLAVSLAGKLGDADCGDLRAAFAEVLAEYPAIVADAGVDLAVSVERNPAYPDALTPFVHAKGFLALEAHRIAHALWIAGRRDFALYVQGRAAEVFAVDIHPAARIGRGVFIDHATGVVIGETAVVADDVSILHSVTLGGTGKERGDRHPKIGRGVLLGVGAKVLGNVTVGEGAKVAAGSVVLRNVPPHVTVAGVPAKVVGRAADDMPSHSMDQDFLVIDFQI